MMVNINRTDLFELIGIACALIFLFVVIAIPVALFIPVLHVDVIFKFFDINSYFIILIVTGIVMFLHGRLRGNLYLKSISSAIRFPENNCHNPHHAIVFPHYEKLSREIYFEDVVSLLIHKLRERDLPYKVYHIWNFTDFRKMYENDNAVHLWLFGHGIRGGLQTDSCLIKYSDFEKMNVKSKDSIHQLHCNPGSDMSLIEVNKPTKSKELHLVKNFYKNNMAINIRKYIKDYFDDPGNFVAVEYEEKL